MDSEARSQNGLLRSLSADDFEALCPHLRTVTLSQSRVLAKVGDPVTHVYLPHSGVISLFVELAQGDRIEVAMIGRDSILNLSGALAETVAVINAIVLLPGVASMLEIDRLRAAIEQRPALRTILARHVLSLFVQAQQTAACNAAHTVESRLARWLLRIRDLTGSDSFVLTQELIAEMIGARRNSVSIVAHSLQRSNYIRYSRGHIEIIDLEGLTRTACECYAAVRTQYEGLLRPAGAKR
jgi:CRP-like cAMP-binding protein